jgi:hypothetical protein
MAVTGKTGADGFRKAIKRQSIIWSHYGPKLKGVCDTMKALGLLDDLEYTALIAAFNALPALMSAIDKVAEYSGFK